MIRADAILLDLDGTRTDAREGIALRGYGSRSEPSGAGTHALRGLPAELPAHLSALLAAPI